jgi:hypothetical protein
VADHDDRRERRSERFYADLTATFGTAGPRRATMRPVVVVGRP